jgi:CheY-like chemotaxis protein
VMLEVRSDSIYLTDEQVRKLAGDLPRNTGAIETRPTRPRVLVVDDEKLIADTCGEILEGAGFEAKTAYDGWAALEMAAEFRPDYLLTDVLMPRMNGVELAIAVNKMMPSVRILLFSGQAGISEILHQGHVRGYEFELIPKPIHPVKLIERLQKQQR